jgi:hypothetical protein
MRERTTVWAMRTYDAPRLRGAAGESPDPTGKKWYYARARACHVCHVVSKMLGAPAGSSRHDSSVEDPPPPPRRPAGGSS